MTLKVINEKVETYSRYVNIAVYKNENTKFFGIWSIPEYVVNAAYSVYEISSGKAFRPDLIAYEVYGNPLLAWVILAKNGIADPFDLDTGLYSGRLIKIPDKIVVFSKYL